MQRTTVMGIAVVSALMAVAAPQSHASGIELRLGAYFPKASSDLFQDANELYLLQKDDWIGIYGGLEFDANLASHLELTASVDGYERSNDTSYARYTDEHDNDIFQWSKLTIVPVGVGLRYVVNPKRGAFTPYLLAGGDVYFYEYRAEGDFIDFQVPGRPIYYDAFQSDGVAWGLHVGAGFRLPLNEDLSMTAEGRYHFAGEVQMDDDFRANRLDVGGLAVTVGVHLRF